MARAQLMMFSLTALGLAAAWTCPEGYACLSETSMTPCAPGTFSAVGALDCCNESMQCQPGYAVGPSCTCVHAACPGPGEFLVKDLSTAGERAYHCVHTPPCARTSPCGAGMLLDPGTCGCVRRAMCAPGAEALWWSGGGFRCISF